MGHSSSLINSITTFCLWKNEYPFFSPYQIFPCYMLHPSPPWRIVEGIPRGRIAQVSRQSTVKCSGFEHFHIKFLQKYSRFNMYITSPLTAGERSVSVLPKKNWPWNITIFYSWRGTRNLCCPASDPKDILDSGITCPF